MKGLQLLFAKNRGLNHNYRYDKRFNANVFYFQDSVINGATIKKIICNVNNYISNFKSIKAPVVFLFQHKNVRIADKLTYVLLECICYELIEFYKIPLQVYINPASSIDSIGIASSPLMLLNGTSIHRIKEYPQKFKLDVYRNHYRKVIRADKLQTNYLGFLQADVATFLKAFDIVDYYRERVSEVVAELVGNACEHTASDCLIDIDVTDDHNKSINGREESGFYYGINIVVVDFSNELIGSALKEKLLDEQISGKRYKDLKNVYLNHEQFFNVDYNEDDFYNIAVFQDKISGRKGYSNAGGTGLTILVKSLEEQSDTNNCYMLSGNKVVYFRDECLNYDDNGWIGFNRNCDFINERPDPSCIARSNTFCPGTAYNLHFVMRREEK